MFNWLIGVESNAYLQFNGTTLVFNETKLNKTITNLAVTSGGNSSFNQSFTDKRYLERSANITQQVGNTQIFYDKWELIIAGGP